jgi:hypothetical protein
MEKQIENQNPGASPKVRKRPSRKRTSWIIRFAPPPVAGQLAFDFNLNSEEEGGEDKDG